MMSDVVGRAPWLLAVDTATSWIVVAAGRPDGAALCVLDWPAKHRHGEKLLAGVEELMTLTGTSRRELAGIVVGTGPGAFTGLRVGLATAKTLAHALGLPIVGVGTGTALLEGASASRPQSARPGATLALLLPAGPNDRVLVRPNGSPVLLPGGMEPVLESSEVVVAVDLENRAPADALELGIRAMEGLGAALLRLGAARLASGQGDDVERLVPEYVTLPRGVHDVGGDIAWSSDAK